MNSVWSHVGLLGIAVAAAINLWSCFAFRPMPSIDSPAELGQALSESEGTLVFGRVRWFADGREVALGSGTEGCGVELHFVDPGTGDVVLAGVGPDGFFGWILTPGAYEVPWVNLVGEDGSIIREVDIRLVVPEGGEAAYLGTLTLDTHRASGAFGWLGWETVAVDEYALWNDCAVDCDLMLARLGLAGEPVRLAFLEPGNDRRALLAQLGDPARALAWRDGHASPMIVPGTRPPPVIARPETAMAAAPPDRP